MSVVCLVTLVTAQPYRTFAKALNVAHVFRLDTHGLAAAIAETPDLASELEDAVGRALAIMARLDVSEEVGDARQEVALLGHLRFFLRGFR